MDTSKQIFEQQKREEKAKNVSVKFIPFYDQKVYHFNVYDAEGKIKYIGVVAKDKLHDECTCHSFMFGNNENYQREHGRNFNCKHLICARTLLGEPL